MLVRVRVPATSANLGPGFDCLGLALRLYNTLELETTSGGLNISISGEGEGTLSTGPGNLAFRAIEHYFQHIGRPVPSLAMRQFNGIPLARGMGSSSAAIVAGIFGADALAEASLDIDELLALAAAMDGHPDNVTPAATGGLAVAVTAGEEVHHLKLLPPRAMQAVLFIPGFEMLTRAARKALPAVYSREDTVFNIGRSSLLASAFAAGRWDLLRTAMADRVHQPYRAAIFPEMPSLIDAAYEGGAFGASLSGAGPTVIALADDAAAAGVAGSMRRAADQLGVTGRVMLLDMDSEGTVTDIL